MQNHPLACAARLFSYVPYRTSRVAGRLSVLIEKKIIVMKLNEILSAQAALRRLGIYSGQVDGILGPDTQRAIKDYQGRNKLPVTGQPDQRLNALLGIF